MPNEPAQPTLMTPWTHAQRDAIDSINENLLVSAAAGSGKTAVLSERCAQLICDPAESCDVDEILVVTFTDAAAAEMRSRIERALRARLKESSDPAAQARLRKQLALLDRAQIGTIDGFCARLLREHFHLVKLDPSFRILDAAEATLLKSQVAREVVDSSIEDDRQGDFARLLDDYANGQDADLAERIVRIEMFLTSVVDPEHWMQTSLSRIEEASGEGFEKSALASALQAMIREEIVSVGKSCSQSIDALQALGGFEGYLKILSNIREHLRALFKSIAATGLAQLSDIASQYQRLKAPAVASGTPHKESAMAMLDSVRVELDPIKGTLGALLRFTPEQWHAGLAMTLPYAKTLLQKVRQLQSAYAAEKSSIRAVDFADLGRLALRVLRDDGPGLAPSRVARQLHRRFKHVLVDEYQDINELQDAILTLISHEAANAPARPNLFCVGDVKQSIYRFRLADPERFLLRLTSFGQSKGEGAGRIIPLSSNFRSRAPLLDAINVVFEKLMTEQAAGLNYDASHRLVPGRTFQDASGTRLFTGSPIEMHILPANIGAASESHDDNTDAGDLEQVEREAAVAASRIHEMLGHMDGQPMHVSVKDKNGSPITRPIRYGDIAILLRTMKFKAEQLASILRDQGIPAQTDGRGGFFDATEIRDMLALLQLLDNRRQDIPLAAFLRSPLAQLSQPEDALARVVIAYRDCQPPVPFHQAVLRYATEMQNALAAELKALLAKLDAWRDLSHHRPLAEAVWSIYQQTGYFTYVSGLISGEQRQANLLELHAKATRFGAFQRQGLSRFLEFLERLRDEADLGRPSTVTGAQDAVRVLSIHQSKGLEFPVVIIPDLGKAVNLMDTQGPILADRKAYLGLDVMDDKLRVRYPSLASTLVRAKIRHEAMAEELRVLYVGMTRAEEHLILIGSCKSGKVETWQQLWGSAAELPGDLIQRHRTPLDWLGPVWASTSTAAHPPIELRNHTAQEIHEITSQPRVDIAADGVDAVKVSADAKAAAEEIIARVRRPYALHAFTTVAAARSVTSLTKGKGARTHDFARDAIDPQCEPRDTVQLEPPTCLANEPSLRATDIGTSTHLAMQHLDFAKVSHLASIVQALDEMTRDHRLTPEQARHVDVASIEWFLGTTLGRTIQGQSKHLRRELPVYLALAAATVADAPDSADPLDQVMIRGRIDLLLPTDDGIDLVDYKTDRVTGDRLTERAEFYSGQMKLYAQAIARVTGQKVNTTHLVFFWSQSIVSNATT